MEHSKTLSHSEAPALFQCARFQSGGNDMFEEYANTGTLMHDYCENKVLGKDTKEIETQLEPEQIEACDESLVKISNLVENKMGSDYKIFTEMRIPILDGSGKELTFGTADLIFVKPGMVIGMDHKADLGFNSSKVDYRPQMESYALGLMQKFKISKVLWAESHIMSRKLKIYEITFDQATATFTAAWRRKHSKMKPQQCYFCRMCKNIVSCPAVIKTMEMVDCLYSDLKDTEDLFNPWKIFSSKKFSNILGICETIEQYQERTKKIVANVRKAALEFMKKSSIPYYRKHTKSSRKIKKIFEAQKKVNMPSDRFEKTLSLALGKFEKQFCEMKKESNPGMTKKKTDEILAEELFNIIEVSEPTISLKRVGTK